MAEAATATPETGKSGVPAYLGAVQRSCSACDDDGSRRAGTRPLVQRRAEHQQRVPIRRIWPDHIAQHFDGLFESSGGCECLGIGYADRHIAAMVGHRLFQRRRRLLRLTSRAQSGCIVNDRGAVRRIGAIACG